MPETRFLTDLGLLFLAALGGGLLAQAVHQPLIVGYILAGVLIGPFTPGPTLSDPHTFQLFADVGVVLLMFTIGVEFAVEELLRVRKVALLGAPAGIALVALLTIPVGKLLGWTLVQSLVAGAAVSVASTMVLLKFLLERGELATLYGRVVVGITLAEDLAVVAMTVLIPALASPGGDRAAALGQALLEAVVLLGPLLWLARRAVPLLLAKVAHTRNMELFLLVALARNAALGLTQIGEFSYILAGVGRNHGLLPSSMYDAVLATSLVTILINALVFRRRPTWVQRLVSGQETVPPPAAAALAPEVQVTVCGFGRVGREVADALDAFHILYTVVDLDPEATREARSRGAGAVFGDAGSEGMLHHAGVDRALLAVVAIPGFEAARRCVTALRALRPDLPILVRVHQQRHRAELSGAGATEVVQPEVEAALTIVRHSLDLLGIDHRLARRYMEGARAHWPEAARAEGVSGDALQAMEVVVQDPALEGQSIEQAHIRERSGAAIVSITRADGREIVNPRPDERLQAGDRLLAIGTREQL